MRRLFPALALVLLPAFAQAQSRPATFPTRDVVVSYRVLGKASPQTPREFTVAALASEGRLRVETPSMPAWGLVDRHTGRSEMVMDVMRVVTPSPVRQEEAMRYLRLAENARLTSAGTAGQAGQRCTNYRWEQQGQRGTACLTADGVLLRGVNERGEGIEAVRVDYVRQDPARFRVPEGYRRVDLGDMGRSLGFGMPRR
ncbi:hypothetical protein [Roseomonas xinghualingensis]|uniref:hypothetical protein n=1 Tax=Roseomonas xinghualingensis TaxID=2986475 RepID=UPI0021F240E0|nr:hypothetical protein [Roseomonas sp. SXEYE001]MCV4208836.1 hypothetical protein [Roseomonas sp. SXEYE001]